MLTHVKKLEKKMTYAEVLDYLDSNLKWKLPSDNDIDELIERHSATDTFHIEGKVKEFDGITCSMTCSGYYSVNIKYTVFLVQKIKNVITDTLFGLSEPVGGLLELSMMHYNSNIINGIQLFNLSKILNNKKLKEVSYMMKTTDLFKI